MALSTLVKISGVNNLSDARFCAGMGASILGFCPEDNHPDFVDLKKFRDITGWIEGVQLAGEFHVSSLQQIRAIDAKYKFDYLQISNPAIIRELKDYGKPLIYNFDLPAIKDFSLVRDLLEANRDSVVYFVFEGKIIDGEKIQKINQWSEKYPILYGGEVTRENITDLVNKYHYRGISLKGGTEIKPGYYDFGNLAEILEMLEVDG